MIFHHVTDGPYFSGFFRSKHMVFLFGVAILVIVFAQLAVRSYRGGKIPRGIGAAVESLVLFIRDEVAEPNIGHGDGRKFTPLLCSFFFFILVSALVGLFPGSRHLDRQHRGDARARDGLVRRRSSGRASRSTASSATSRAWSRPGCRCCCCRS